MKRELFSAPIKRVEDPELSWILREKQRELDWQLTALAARDSRDFLYGSLLAFGNVDPSLLRVARNVLERVPPSAGSDPDARKVTASEFAARARREIDFFQTAARPGGGRHQDHCRHDRSHGFTRNSFDWIGSPCPQRSSGGHGPARGRHARSDIH